MSEETKTDAPPSPKKLKVEPPPPCPRCAAMTEFPPDKRINALVETCRDLIARIEATEGPETIFQCIDPASGFRFRAVKNSKVRGSFKIISRHDVGIRAIEYTTFKMDIVSNVDEAKDVIQKLLDTKEQARSQVSPERYKIISHDVIDRLLRIQDLLSDTHDAATIDTEKLNYKFKKMLKPHEIYLCDEVIINLRHTVFVDPGNTCTYTLTNNNKCNGRAIIYCKLCKKHYCEIHIQHNPVCYMNECAEGCGCSDSEDE